MPKTRNFRSREAYDRWVAYDKIHVDSNPSTRPVKITINGVPHHVNHCPHCHLDSANRCGAHCR